MEKKKILDKLKKERDLPWEELMEITMDVESYCQGLDKAIKIINENKQ